MGLKGCHVLIVDDEEDLLEMVVEAFEEEGCHVYSANNGQDALDLFLKHEVRVIIADESMPKLNGHELLAKVLESSKPNPLYFFSTGSMELTENELQKKGATGLITKPFDLDVILEIIDKKLDSCG
jgi:two-component system response regulator GlrR